MRKGWGGTNIWEKINMRKKTPHNRLELETYCRVNTGRPCFKGKPGSANYYSVCNCIFPGLYGACFF